MCFEAGGRLEALINGTEVLWSANIHHCHSVDAHRRERCNKHFPFRALRYKENRSRGTGVLPDPGIAASETSAFIGIII